MNNTIEKARAYYRDYGFKKTVIKVGQSLENRIFARGMEKRMWKVVFASDKQLEEWSKISFDYNPKISILIPMYHTPLNFFKELIEVIQGQIYTNWELCLADGSGEDTEAGTYAEALQKADARIKYQRLESNEGISGNTNAALDMATGDFIALCDHDDLITRDALFHVVRALNSDETIDSIYTDEDKMNMEGTKYFDPAFKPDFNIDLLRSGNYITHLFVTRKELADGVRFQEEYDGAQDYNFIFRCCEQSRRIYHVPRLLYHWRCHENSTAGNPESKMYAYEAGRKALQDHMERAGLNGTAERSPFIGYYYVNYDQPSNLSNGRPKISVISTKDLRMSVKKQIINATANHNENEKINLSETADASALINADVEFCLFDGAYNPVNINEAVHSSTGDLLLFIDPRVHHMADDCARLLLAPHQRPDLASTFAKVISDKADRIYSAGIILGCGGTFGRAFEALQSDHNGFMMRLKMPQNLTASDLTCAMIKRTSYEAVGGMNEEVPYIYSAVDLYVRMGKEGHLHLFEPRAVAVIDAPVKVGFSFSDLECSKEADEAFKGICPLPNGYVDPNYNPHFSHYRGGFVPEAWSELKHITDLEPLE